MDAVISEVIEGWIRKKEMWQSRRKHENEIIINGISKGEDLGVFVWFRSNSNPAFRKYVFITELTRASHTLTLWCSAVHHPKK